MVDADGRDGAAAAKAALRRRVRRTRAAAADVSDSLCRTALGAAPVGRVLGSGGGPAGPTVLAYAAVPGEPDPVRLREALRAAGVRVLLPVVTGPRTLAWARDTGRLAPGRALAGGTRLPEPDPPAAAPLEDLALGPADLALVPALAVARDGTRLGQGGGFYDRALADLRRHPSGPLVVAVVHDDEVLPTGEVPHEPHDLRVDAVLTPTAWLPLRPGTEASPAGG